MIKECKLFLVVKFFKLFIIRFNGRVEEWFFFWRKFIFELDFINLVFFIKFGYLNELLKRYVSKCIEELLFIGYINVKVIFKVEYG